MALFLDTGILGLITTPRGNDTASACLRWLLDCLLKRSSIYVPEIADYELRRELLLQRKSKTLARLDELVPGVAHSVPITTEAMREAAQLWADLRHRGQPTAGEKE